MGYFSIIVPVYNVEPYLEEGLNSIIKLDIKDLEIICINDGSTDNSLNILQSFAIKDPRIIVINQKNQGVSVARNIGIEKATGQYISFFDPDDYIDYKVYKDSINECYKHNLDILISSYYTTQSPIPIIEKFPKNRIVSPSELLKSCKNWHSSCSISFSWRMFFKRSLIYNNNIRFNPQINVGEDSLFNMTAICHSNRVYYKSDAYYYYRLTSTSTMANKFKPSLEKSLTLQYQEEVALIKSFKTIPFNRDDFYRDIYLRYTIMLLNNLKNDPNKTNKTEGIKHILCLPMIIEAKKAVGLKYIYSSLKECIFFLFIRFNCPFLINKVIFKK